VLSALIRCKTEFFPYKPKLIDKNSASHLSLFQRLYILSWAKTIGFSSLKTAYGLLSMRSRFFSDSGVFATMTAEFRNETGLYFKPVQELALRHKAGRTERWAAGLSRHAWGFSGFCQTRTQDIASDPVFLKNQRKKENDSFWNLILFVLEPETIRFETSFYSFRVSILFVSHFNSIRFRFQFYSFRTSKRVTFYSNMPHFDLQLTTFFDKK